MAAKFHIASSGFRLLVLLVLVRCPVDMVYTPVDLVSYTSAFSIITSQDMCWVHILAAQTLAEAS